jgi:hypothetical protein
MSLLVATPLRAATLATAYVTYGYCDFRDKLRHHMPDYTVLSGSIVFSLDVVRARNRVAGFILQRPEFTNIDNVLWVDDDNFPENVAIVSHMIDRRGDIVAASYTNKKEPLRWVHSLDPRTGEILGVGFGFTMTARHVLEKLAKEAKWYVDYFQGGNIEVPNIFGQMYDRFPGTEVDTLLSEDYSFCKRARDAGFKIEMVPGVIHHAGGHLWGAKR